MMIYAIAGQFVGNKTFSNKLKSINELMKGELGSKVREVVTGGTTPDNECKKAKERGKSPAQHYKSINERTKGDSAVPVKKTIITKARGLDSNGRQTQFTFNAEMEGECGDCWMCGLPVKYYYGADGKGNNWLTSCGECEHIGAITASFLTGMLTSANLDIQSYNYGTSHVHCNQNKSDNISMEFNGQQWVRSRAGISIIANKIITANIHGSEYDPVFIEEFTKSKMDNKQAFINKIITNIEGVTDEWCRIANKSILSVPSEKKTKGLKLTKQIEEATIELMKQTKNYRKFNGGVRSAIKQPNIVSSSSSSSNTKGVVRSDNTSMNVDRPTDDKKQQVNKIRPISVTPSLSYQQLQDDETEITFKQSFGERAFDILYELHQLQESYDEDFFQNVDDARKTIKTSPFKELNEELYKFNNSLYKSKII